MTLPAFGGLAVLAGLLLLHVWQPPVLVQARLNVFDLWQRLAPRAYTPLPVRVVDIDDATLAEHGQWPWPRWRVAALIERLHALGAAVIVLDVLFPEADRTSPQQLPASWPPGSIDPGIAARLASLPDHDALLAAAFGKARVVTSFGLIGSANDARPVAKAAIAQIGPDPMSYLPRYPGAISNLPLLENAARGNGSFSVVATVDEVIRRLPLVHQLHGQVYPALALEALRVAQGQDTVQLRSEPGRGLSRIRAGQVVVPVSADGAFWLHYTEDAPARTLSAGAVLTDTPGARLAATIGGNIVLIGTSAVGLKDLRATPLNPFAAGVTIHAQAIEQMLLGHWLSRPAWALGAERVALALLGLVLLTVLLVLPARFGVIAALLLFVALLVGTYVAFDRYRLLLDPVAPALGLLAVYLTTASLVWRRAEHERSYLRTAFSQYMAPQLVKRLLSQPDSLRVGGESRELSFLFTDIAGFTSLSERTPPATLVRVLNTYLDAMCGIIMAHGGTVDKIVGDAVHGMFNAPLDQADHAARAVACALALDRFGQDFTRQQRAAGIAFGDTRIGVNTGTAVIGNFGGTHRFDYTAHGDAINTAARLESVNKHLGTRVCVAGSTAAQCPDQAFRPVGCLVLKGKEQGIEAFEPLDAEASASPAVRAYREAFPRLVQNDPTAPALFADLHERFPDDPLIALHHGRLTRGEGGATLRLNEK